MVKPLTKMQRAARGEACTLRVPLIHVPDPENSTSVLCHAPFPDRGGMRDRDWFAAIGCSRCHDWIDGRDGGDGGEWKRVEAAEAWLQGIRETQQIFINKGLIVVL